MTILKGRITEISRSVVDGKLRARLVIFTHDGKYVDAIAIPNTDGLVLDDEVLVEVRRNNEAVHTSPLAATAEEVAEVARG